MISENLDNQIWNKERRVEVDEQIIEGLIEWFQVVKKRPLMYIGENNPKFIENGLWWFHIAFTHLGYNFQPQNNAITKRDLHKTAKGLERQLRERGLSDEEIISEIVDIEIENWKQLLKEIRAKKQK